MFVLRRSTSPDLNKIISAVRKADPFFEAFWYELGQPDQERFLLTASKISDFSRSARCDEEEHRIAAAFLQIQNVIIRETPLLYNKIPRSWPSLVKDEAQKTKAFKLAYDYIDSSFRKEEIENRFPYFYGNIKTDKSLNIKQNIKGDRKINGIRREADLRDVIRFRIVLPDVKELINTCVGFWRENFRNIIYCHNYYVSPKSGDINNTYKAVHMNFLLKSEILVELQFVTEYREVLGHMDYSRYKGIKVGRGSGYKNLIDGCRMAANIMDVDKSWPNWKERP